MESDDSMVTKNNYCFTKPGEVYLVYLPYGGETSLDLSGTLGTYSIQWYNPRTDGELMETATNKIEGGNKIAIGSPPEDPEKDWAILIRKVD